MEIRLGPSCNLIQRGGESEVGPAGGLSVVRSLQACLPTGKAGQPSTGLLLFFIPFSPPLPFCLSSFKNFPFSCLFLIFLCIYGGTHLSLCEQFSLEGSWEKCNIKWNNGCFSYHFQVLSISWTLSVRTMSDVLLASLFLKLDPSSSSLARVM